MNTATLSDNVNMFFAKLTKNDFIRRIQGHKINCDKIKLCSLYCIFIQKITKKEGVLKICSSPRSKRLNKSTFKIIIEGEIPLKFLNNFVSLDVIRDGNILRMVKYEIIEKIKSLKT